MPGAMNRPKTRSGQIYSSSVPIRIAVIEPEVGENAQKIGPSPYRAIIRKRYGSHIYVYHVFVEYLSHTLIILMF